MSVSISLLLDLELLAVSASIKADPAFSFTVLPTKRIAFRDGISLKDTPSDRFMELVRLKLLGRMGGVSKFIHASEPGVSRYALVVPPVDDGKTV